jgi:multisubunit Na+/H+ antiporter MnhB subunit
MLVTIAWLRLGAADVAIAEAAVGTGLTGVILLSALTVNGGTQRGRRRRPPALAVPAVLAALVIILVFAEGQEPQQSLARTVSDRAPELGLRNPVTAVLLGFRAFDTLLEIAVLVLAAFSGLALSTAPARRRAREVDPVLTLFVRRMVPIGLLVAGYLWWSGTTRPGGAFQAGTVLGVLWVFLALAGLVRQASPAVLAGRLLLVCGLALFLIVGASGLLTAGSFLAYAPGASASLIILVEAAMMISIAGSLAALVALVAAPEPGRGADGA